MQNPSGLGFEIWVSRKDPTAVLPRTDSVLVKPSLDAGVAEGCPLRPQARTWEPSSATLQRERGASTRLGNSRPSENLAGPRSLSFFPGLGF
jgi:hypothetical protein